MTLQTRYEAHFGRMVRCFAQRPATIDALFRDAVERRPDARAIVMDDQTLSYRAMDEIVARLTANLAGQSVAKGDRIALLLDNVLCREAAAGFGQQISMRRLVSALHSL